MTLPLEIVFPVALVLFALGVWAGCASTRVLNRWEREREVSSGAFCEEDEKSSEGAD